MTISMTTMIREGAARVGEVLVHLEEPMVEPLFVSTNAAHEEVARLLDAVAREDAAHSWKNFDRTGSLEDLRRWENRLRPTEIFFYYLRRGNVREIVGAAAVAANLNDRFTQPGFSVLGRCFILPEYRGRGYYRQVLQLRLEHCRTRFGAELKAVHIGSDNERISSVIMGEPLPGWPRFVHLGEEALHIAGRIKRVNAYLLLMPSFAASVAQALAKLGDGRHAARMRWHYAAAERGDRRNLGLSLGVAITALRAEGSAGVREVEPLDQLLAFCRAVPLVGLK